jgi:hypothetical protein
VRRTRNLNLSKDDVSVECHDNVLTVKGEKRDEREETELNCRLEAGCVSSAIRKDSGVMLCGGNDRIFPGFDV